MRKRLIVNGTGASLVSASVIGSGGVVFGGAAEISTENIYTEVRVMTSGRYRNNQSLIMYAPLDDLNALKGAATVFTQAENFITPTYTHGPSRNYAVANIRGVHPSFSGSTSINSSSGSAFMFTGLSGLPFPKRGTIQFWIRPNTTLSNYDGILSTSNTGANNQNEIKMFYDLGAGMYLYSCGTSYSGLNTGTLTAGSVYLYTVTWDFLQATTKIWVFKNTTTYTLAPGTQTPSTWGQFELGSARRDGTRYTPDACFNGLYISSQMTSYPEHLQVYKDGRRRFTI